MKGMMGVGAKEGPSDGIGGGQGALEVVEDGVLISEEEERT